MVRILTTSIFSFMFFSGCIYKTSSESVDSVPPSLVDKSNPQSQIKVEKEDPISCHKTDFNPLPINTIEKINIERHFQRVIRFDCKHEVVSDEIETVKSPHGGNVKIHPKALDNLNLLPTYKGKWLEIINRQRCEGGAYSYTDDDHMEVNLFLDMAPGFLSFQVIAGINIVDYSFYICESVNANQECISKLVEEKGSLVIDVEYFERNLDGVLEIYNSDCTN